MSALLSGLGSMTWLAITMFAKRVGTSVITFLARLNGWQLLCLGLALFGAVQTIRVKAEERHSTKLAAQLTKLESVNHSLQAQLDAISSKKDVQRQVTRDNLKIVTRTIHEKDQEAQKVESQPLPQTECHGVTPSGVREADV